LIRLTKLANYSIFSFGVRFDKVVHKHFCWRNTESLFCFNSPQSFVSALEDLLRHANFKSCARADCGIPFARISGHNQIYCSAECAHVVSQRALRERNKKKEWNRP